ncbi:MAG: hypothetical protein ACPG5T_06550 [Endozoicomonas sp.]
MAGKIKLVDVTKLKKSNVLVTNQTEKVLRQAKALLEKQEAFMAQGGMDRQKLRAFINSDAWSPHQRQKARQELIRWHEELKNGMAHDASVKQKELKLSARLLKPGRNQVSKRSQRRRTGFL